MQTLFVSAGRMETFDFATPIGVGMINAAINLSKILAHKKYEKIIFLGSCGVYDEDLPLKRLFLANTFTQYEHPKSSSFYSPIELEIIINIPKSKLIQASVNSSNHICKDKLKAYKYKEAKCMLENMESFSVASCAKAYGCELGVLLCSTNYCDENAHENFMKNYKLSNEMLEDYARSCLL